MQSKAESDVTSAPGDASAGHRSKQQIAGETQRKLQEWLDMTCDSGSRQSALIRSDFVYCSSHRRNEQGAGTSWNELDHSASCMAP